jgi:hypothetical protein
MQWVKLTKACVINARFVFLASDNIHLSLHLPALPAVRDVTPVTG